MADRTGQQRCAMPKTGTARREKRSRHPFLYEPRGLERILRLGVVVRCARGLYDDGLRAAIAELCAGTNDEISAMLVAQDLGVSNARGVAGRRRERALR